MSVEDYEIEDSLEGIAIIGMAGRFPGADSVEAFWQNLIDGVFSISTFTYEECKKSGVPEYLLKNPNFVKRGAVLKDPDLFDARFFGYTPGEAAYIDPQQRIFLECSWEALENAGYDPGEYKGSIGVYAGCGMNYYLLKNLIATSPQMESVITPIAFFGNEKDFLTTRVSYKLNLTGPSVAIQTACSTSLVAVQLACQGLMTYQCDMAISGGVSIQTPRMKGYVYNDGHILSSDGYCRAFDKNASGTVFGEGVGIVVLKRLKDAINDRDTIYAVIKGIAINNDGSDKVSYAAPSVNGQAEVIAMAQALAEVEADDISYIETHGTGTPLGDSIELAALKQAFQKTKKGIGYCAIGSVKPNIGHLDVAAGIAGLIKTAMAIKNKKLPASLFYNEPNPELKLESSPFYVNDKLSDWKTDGKPLMAGLSSFGLGGTNSHAILTEAPPMDTNISFKPSFLLLISAKTETALEKMTENLSSHFKKQNNINLSDAAYTLQTGRRHFKHRRFAVCENTDNAIEFLESSDSKRVHTGIASEQKRDVVFMFTGQGSQYVNMAKELYLKLPVFKEEMDRCADILFPFLNLDLRDIFYPDKNNVKKSEELLQETSITQPALFSIEYALAKFWISCGVSPHSMIGHSIGEYVAACISGVFTLNEALELVAMRGRLMQSQERGSMLAILLPEEDVKALINDRLSIAAVNSPLQCVVSGTENDIEKLQGALSESSPDGKKKVRCQILQTSHAFHSWMMEPVVKPLMDFLEKIDLQPPEIPFISNVTGTWITGDQVTDPAYWATHLQHTVRFSDGIKTLISESDKIMLEVGPGMVLTSLARLHFNKDTGSISLPSVRRSVENESDYAFLLKTLGSLWIEVGKIDWKGLYQDEPRMRIPLPTYPFERERYWIEPQARVASDSDYLLETENAISITELNETGLNAGISIAANFLVENKREAGLTKMEKIVLRIWKEVLYIDQIGIEDDFFEIGGDSLMGGQVISRLQNELLERLTVKLLFEYPTVKRLAGYLDGEKNREKKQAHVLTKIQHDKRLPISSSQKRLWFIHQMAPESPAYNIVQAIKIKGELNTDVLQKSLDAILMRHESLRTAFKTRDGQPFVALTDFVTVKIEKFDFRNAIAGVSEKQAVKTVIEKAPVPFDMETGPLVRPLLLRIDEAEYVFVLIMHHIISDGWSMGVWMNELFTNYSAFVKGKSSPLKELEFHYSDYAASQEQWFRDEDFSRQIEYWTNLLEGNLPVLQIPADYLRPSIPQYHGALQYVTIDKETAALLHKLNRDENCTMFITLLSAFMTFLYRYTGQTTIVVGAPHSNREVFGTENLIGFFLNMLPLRGDLSGEMRFTDLLRYVRNMSLEAYANNLPFEKIVENLKLERLLNFHPLFQVMFAYQNFPLPSLESNGLSVKPIFMDRGTTEYDLSLYMWEEEGRITGAFEYSRELFKPETVSYMVEYFLTLLRGIVSGPEQTLEDFPLLTKAEHDRLIDCWNKTDSGYPEEQTVSLIFEAMASRSPDAVAITFEDQSLTYDNLNQKANQLANRLRKLGAGPGALIGIYMNRSIDLAVCLLAIHKAGAAYIPLDPAFPKDRLGFMVEDSKLEFILSHQTLQKDLPHTESIQVVFIDAQWDDIAGEESDNIAQTAGYDDLAYVIYTSGSTGKPKGVQITNRALINFLFSMKNEPGLNSSDILLSVTTMSFDIFGLEIFLPLITGATCSIVSQETAVDGKELIRNLRLTNATVMQATPTTWSMMLDAGWKDANGLKALCGGEALPRDLANRILETGAELWNLYGPTETTIWSAICRVQPGNEQPDIGHPIANTKLYVLDSKLNPTPIGIPGELYIGGDGLAKGYLNRDSLTAEKFIPNPFDSSNGSRIYRTGDLVKRLSDGRIEFLGRVDFQVKIRGLRIELGEIEEVLNKHPLVKDSIVLAREDNPGDKRLVAYLVADFISPPADQELREHLRKNLPNYMMPSAFVKLKEFPLTPNNKKDRNALPKLEMVELEKGEEYIAPRDQLELKLTAIWQKLLGIKSISVKDDFFDLGGHSLLAARMFAQIEKELGKNLPLSILFQHSTLEQLANVIRQEDWVPTWSPLVPIQTKGDRLPIFLVHGAEGNVLLYRELALYLGNEQPVYGLQSEGLSGKEKFMPRVETMAAQYIEEIKIVQPEGPYLLGGYCLGGVIAYEMARQLKDSGDKVGLVAMIETYNVHINYNYLSKYYLSYNRIQNVMFHIGNLMSLSKKDMWSFFKQKAKVEIDRGKIWLAVNTAKLGKIIGLKNGLVYHHIRVDKANDQAYIEYFPESYSGKVTLFLPKKDYAGFDDPEYGWGDIAQGGVEIYRLSNNPHGSLVEPFVKDLSKKIAECINNIDIADCK